MDAKQKIHQTVTQNPVVLYMKGTKQFPTCGFSGRATQILKACGVGFVDVNVLADPEVVPALREYANWPTIPVLYINGEFIGGCDIMTEMYQAGELQQKLAAVAQPA
ncbi:MAG TPA: Grx4 family monothiol glutaredoxin [Rhodocyclaceae bacterium]|nr:Grx4 family monothiol glutaredoxin [Rhodocyclaceae bacterium]